MTRKMDLAVMGTEVEIEQELEDLAVMGDTTAKTTAADRIAAEVLGVFQPNEDFDRARTDANVELIQLVAQFLTDQPTMRFGQALSSLDLLVDAPLAEPQLQLKRAKAALKRMGL